MVGYKVKDVTDVHGAAEPIDFHEPDWHESVAPVLSWATRPVVSARRSEIPSAAGVQDVFAVTVFPGIR